MAEIFKAMGGKDILVKLEEFVGREEDWRVNESYQMALSACLEQISKEEFG